jgi:hypothetical protein
MAAAHLTDYCPVVSRAWVSKSDCHLICCFLHWFISAIGEFPQLTTCCVPQVHAPITWHQVLRHFLRVIVP